MSNILKHTNIHKILTLYMYVYALNDIIVCTYTCTIYYIYTYIISLSALSKYQYTCRIKYCERNQEVI